MRVNISFPVVWTDGRAYGHVITKFSRMGRLPHFLSYGAPQVQESAETVDQEKVNTAVLENVEPAPVKKVDCPFPKNVETVAAPLRERVNEEQVRRT